MIEAVLDASAVLAVLKGEPHDAELEGVLEGAVISAVNLAEVWSKLDELGLRSHPDVSAVWGVLGRVEPFTTKQAQLTADLRLPTRSAGLSLGDRACLALAQELNATAYTSESAWLRVPTGCAVHVVR